MADPLLPTGGEPGGRHWRYALVGGPLGRVLGRDGWETARLDFAALPGLGHGGIVMLDESVGPAALARHLFDFARAESCGTCAPCRIGTAQLARMRDLDALERLLDTIVRGSLCGFGHGVPRPIRDLIALEGRAVLG